MDDMTWSTEWKQDLYTWIEESRGEWDALGKELGSEGPQKVVVPIAFAVQEVGPALFAELDHTVRIPAENVAKPPDTLDVTFVREEGHPGRADQIVVLSAETFMHLLGMLLGAVGGEAID